MKKVASTETAVATAAAPIEIPTIAPVLNPEREPLDNSIQNYITNQCDKIIKGKEIFMRRVKSVKYEQLQRI